MKKFFVFLSCFLLLSSCNREFDFDLWYEIQYDIDLVDDAIEAKLNINDVNYEIDDLETFKSKCNKVLKDRKIYVREGKDGSSGRPYDMLYFYYNIKGKEASAVFCKTTSNEISSITVYKNSHSNEEITGYFALFFNDFRSVVRITKNKWAYDKLGGVDFFLYFEDFDTFNEYRELFAFYNK